MYPILMRASVLVCSCVRARACVLGLFLCVARHSYVLTDAIRLPKIWFRPASLILVPKTKQVLYADTYWQHRSDYLHHHQVQYTQGVIFEVLCVCVCVCVCVWVWVWV